MSTVCFVIPVRHPDNMRDKQVSKRHLASTINSIAGQTSADWKAVIVGNPEMDLPELPANFAFQPVDFPPNDQHERGSLGFDAFMEHVRWDKGRRCFAARDHFMQSRFTMIVDDDDFVNRNLVAFMQEGDAPNGCYIEDGYIWKNGSTLIFPTKKFHRKCGTSAIIRSALYDDLRAMFETERTFISEIFGAHLFAKPRLEHLGHPLARTADGRGSVSSGRDQCPYRGTAYKVAAGRNCRFAGAEPARG